MKESKKATWTTPRLIVHGSVEKITKQLGRGGGDGPFGPAVPS
jgi:hypothetical protein